MKLGLNQLDFGMITELDVCDRAGRVLVEAGTVLDKSHLKLMKAWGVEQVSITGGEKLGQNISDADIDDNLLEEAREQAISMYAHNDLSDPIIKALLDETIMCLVREKQAK